MSLSGKVAVITGGALGHGRYIARQYAQNGAQVAIADIDDAGMKEVEELLTKESGGLHLIRHVDIRYEDQVKAFVEEVAATFGRIDILVNNAAIIPHGTWKTKFSVWPPVKEMELSFWKHVISVQLDGSFLLMKYCIPYMESQGEGHIINVMGLGYVYYPNTARLSNFHALPFHVAKGSFHNMTQYVGEDLRDSNICVIGISGEPFASDRTPDEARKRLPGPEVLGDRFLLAAEAPMELTGMWVKEAPRHASSTERSPKRRPLDLRT